MMTDTNWIDPKPMRLYKCGHCGAEFDNLTDADQHGAEYHLAYQYNVKEFDGDSWRAVPYGRPKPPPAPTTNHISHILQTAEQTVNQRAADRDTSSERSMAATVAAFNAIHGTNLTEAQGWNFMVLLKIKRAFTGGYKDDDHVDMAAYVALCAEAMTNAETRT